jgi:hypothetical protein
MKWIRSSSLIAFLLLTCVHAQAQITLTLLADIDVTSTSNAARPERIGNNPSAVAWNGTDAWLAGYNTTGAAANVSIVKLSNVLSTPTFGTAFGTISANSSRGISALLIRGNQLVAALDNGGGSGDSVRAFDVLSETQQWRIGDPGAGNDSTRRGNGIAFDPGFNGADAGQGFAYLSIGSGRRHLLNPANGTYKFGQNAGMIMNLSPVSTTWRALDFDPDTGDIYARESGRVTKATRTGDNALSGSASSVIFAVDPPASLIDNQNLAFVKSSAFGKFLIFNDRRATSTGQAFTDIIKAVDTNGNALTLDFGTFSAAAGNGAYNFSFHAPSQTLAISDFNRRRLYIFRLARTATIEGTLNFQDLSVAAGPQQMTFEFRSNTGGATFTRNASVDATGGFSFPGLNADNFTIHVTGSRYLARNIEVNASAGGTFSVQANMLPGDLNQDNIIDLFDLITFFEAYGTQTGDLTYNVLADITEEGTIDLFDLISFFSNYGAQGDP